MTEKSYFYPQSKRDAILNRFHFYRQIDSRELSIKAIWTSDTEISIYINADLMIGGYRTIPMSMLFSTIEKIFREWEYAIRSREDKLLTSEAELDELISKITRFIP